MATTLNHNCKIVRQFAIATVERGVTGNGAGRLHRGAAGLARAECRHPSLSYGRLRPLYPIATLIAIAHDVDGVAMPVFIPEQAAPPVHSYRLSIVRCWAPVRACAAANPACASLSGIRAGTARRPRRCRRAPLRRQSALKPRPVAAQ